MEWVWGCVYGAWRCVALLLVVIMEALQSFPSSFSTAEKRTSLVVLLECVWPVSFLGPGLQSNPFSWLQQPHDTP